MSRFRALPYAKALYQVVTADHPQRVEEVVSELESLAAVLSAVPDFHRALVTPMVSPETKAAILEQVLDALGIAEPTRRFASVVQQHYRMQHMAEIAGAYRETVDRARGRTRATVEVAVQLSAADRAKVISVVAEILGTEVIADFVETPELLAGFRVHVGSKVFDGSLVGQLDRLSRTMLIE
jgi:F-type H+-transporting ATPase subunit delta